MPRRGVEKTQMQPFEIGILPPALSLDIFVLLAAARAGELPILDCTRDTSRLGPQFAALREVAGPRFGIKTDLASAPTALTLLQQEGGVDLILVTGDLLESELALWVAKLRPLARRLFREVICQAEADAAVAAGVDGLIAKGQESGGRVGNETTFILLQRLSRRYSVTLWAQGGIGPNATAACRVAGAQGIVLDNQLALAAESSLPEDLRGLVAVMDGSETVCLGESFGSGFRVHRYRGSVGLRTLQELEAGGADRATFESKLSQMLGQTQGTELFPIGQEGAFAARLAAENRNVAGIVRAYRARATDNLALAAMSLPLQEGGPLAQAQGTRFPIVQGPMTRVSDCAAFADCVARAGALPFLALALLREPEVERLLREAAALLGESPWGVGILGFVPPELRTEQLRAVLKARPRFALLAGGRPDQARALESAGIHTYIHTPSPRLLQMFLQEGTRRFVFEGRECGGHVGPLSSFVLWESVLNVLLDFQARKEPREAIDVLFAGGIHDGLSAAMVSALAAPAAAAGIRIGALLGTAYLFTREAVGSGAIVPSFQEEAVGCRETVLLDADGGHAIRCAPSAYAEEFKQLKRSLAAAGTPPEEARRRLEEINVGRLRIASKGLARSLAPINGNAENGLVSLPVEQQKREGMFMMGQIASLRQQLCSMEELHREVSEGSSVRLRACAAGGAAKPGERGATVPKGTPEPIAIVGMSCMLPQARDMERFWSNILRNFDAIQEVPAERFSTETFYDPQPSAPDRINSRWGGFIDPILFDPLHYGIPPASLGSIEPVHLLMLEVVRALMKDAGYDRRPFDRGRTGIIVGTGGSCWDLALAYQTRCMVEHYAERAAGIDAHTRTAVLREMRNLLPRITEDSFPGILGNVLAGRIANRLDLGGPNFTVDAACASSLGALEVAIKELRYGSADMMISGGAEGAQNLFAFLLFSKTGALSPRGRCRPFDASADGIAISEGVAAILLKRLEDAVRDGDRIYAVIRGIAAASDGRDKSLTAPSVIGQRRALERAYDSAALSPATVGLVEAHGTGTVAGDRAELETLLTVFGSAGAEAQSCALGSVKSQIGHTKNVAGLAGVIKTTLALHQRVLPPTLVEQVHPSLRDPKLPLYLNTRTRPWFQSDGEPRRAAVSAFGFGGTDFHTVLEEFGAHTSALAERPAQLFVFRAASKQDLVTIAESLCARLATAREFPLAELALALARESLRNQGECRLAIVANDRKDLEARLKEASDWLRSGKATNLGPIAYTENSVPGKIAFLYPGQGSQYLNMLAELAVCVPGVRECFEGADTALSGLLPAALSRVIFPPPACSGEAEQEQRRTLDQTWYAQPALGAADMAVHGLLVELGVRPDMVGGHSYGEYAALCAAGCLSFTELMRISELRGRVVQETQGRGAFGMVAVQESGEALAALIDGESGLSIAGWNAPRQTMVGGPTAAIEAFTPRLKAAGIDHQRLAMSAAFHIPQAAPAAAHLAEVLEKTEFRPPQIAIFSNVTGEPYPQDTRVIRRLLAQQLTSAIRFCDQVETMYQAGARIFIEAGPGQVLSGLARQTLAGRDVQILTANRTQSDSAFADWLRLVGRLFVSGVPLRLERLFAGCAIPLRATDEVLKPADSPSATAWRIDGGSARPLHEMGATSDRKPPSVASSKPRLSVPAAAEAQAPAAPPTQLPQPARSQPPVAASGAVPAANNALVEALAAFQGAMRSFLEYQTRAQEQRQELMTSFLATQRAVFEAFARGGGAAISADAPQWPASFSSPNIPAATVPPPTVVSRTLVTETSEPEVAAPPAAAVASAEYASVAPYPEPSSEDLRALLVSLVSERTGYPAQMLSLDYNMEADLGIDSIKRIEIFGVLAERMHLATDGSEREQYFISIAQLRTLREVLAWLEKQLAEKKRLASTELAAPAVTASAEEPARPIAKEDPEVPIRRHVVRAVAGHTNGNRREIAKGQVVLIVENRHGHGRELALALEGLGHRAALVRHGGEARAAGPGQYEADLLSRDAVRQLRDWTGRHFGKLNAICHLLPLGTPQDVPETAALEVKSLFRLASTFGAELRETRGMIMALTAMGGSFGVCDAPQSLCPGQAAIPGFLKALAHEWPEVLVKSVDVNPEEFDLLGPQLQAVLETNDPTVEVGYSTRGRSVLQVMESELAPLADPPMPLDPDSVVLVTGGARGITAAIACELASRCRPKLILAGRSPAQVEEEPDTRGVTAAAELKRILAERRLKRGEFLTPVSVEAQYRALVHGREVRCTLDRLARLGVRVEYHAFDVRDTSRLESLVASLYERYGRIDGVIHGAGIQEDALLAGKSVESFDRVYDTKVAPALALARALRPEALRFLVFFSSVAARWGYAGGTDYAAANEVLNKLAGKLDREWPARVVSIGWGPWAEMGMATRYPPELMMQHGFAFIPPRVGCDLFLRELAQGRKGETEVLFYGATRPAILTASLDLVTAHGVH